MIIFIHIPRTAGTALTNTLRQNYSNYVAFSLFPPQDFGPAVRRRHNLSLIDFSTTECEEANALGQICPIYETANLISGHITYGIDRCLQKVKEKKYISLVRSPKERVWSLFRIMTSSAAAWNLNRLKAKMERWPVLMDMLESGEFPEFTNDQSRMLLGKSANESFSIQEVIDHIEAKYLYVSHMERYLGVLQDIKKLLNLGNVCDKTVPSTTWDIMPDEKTYDKIIEYNQIDYKLWEYVRKKEVVGHAHSIVYQ